MEMASASAPSTSSHGFSLSLAQAVLTLSINAVVVFLAALFKSSTSSSSSSSSSRRRESAPAPAATAEPSPAKPAKPASAGAIDMDVVLGLMGAAGSDASAAASVGFVEAAALFDEEEATVEEARAAFAVFDRDGDGFIDAAELRSVLASLGFQAGAAADECQRMIDAYDEDKDGRIGFHEFVNLMETSA
ncbi:unnamed protein product [Urochloa humidicola]